MWINLQEAAIGLQTLRERDEVHGELASSEYRYSKESGGVDNTPPIEDKDSEAVRWRSPESLRGASDSEASDVYSFGMCILEFGSGQVPWGTVSSSVVHMLVSAGRLPRRPECMSESQWQLATSMCAQSQRLMILVVVHKLQQIVDQLAEEEYTGLRV